MTALVRQGYAQQIDPATDNQPPANKIVISADDFTSGAWTTLSGPVITETSAGQISLGFIEFTAPAGYEWDITGADPTVTVTLAPGQNGNTMLDIVFSSRTASTISFEVVTTSDNGPRRPARATFSGFRIRPTTGTVPNSGFITNSGSAAPAGNTNYGTLTMVAGAPAKIRVETTADGSGEVVPAQDIRAGNSLTVYSITRDQNDNFLQNIAADSWSIINGTNGVTESDLTVADDSKSATFSSTDVGTGQIQALTAGLTATPSGTITVKAAAPSSIIIQTQPSAVNTAGQILDTQPVLHVLDVYGNRVKSDFSTPVNASVENGTAELQGTLTESAVEGIVTFTDLSYTIVDTVNITFSASGFSPVVSNDIIITPAAAAKLAFTRQPTNASKNVALDPGPVVQVQDEFGNNVSQSGSSITMAVETGPANFTNTSTLNATTNANGQALFSNLILGVNGSYTIKASAAGLTAAVSEAFKILDAGVLAQFKITTTSDTPIGTQTAGQSFTVKIKALDGRGQLLDGTGVPAYNKKAYITITGNTGTGLNDSTAAFSNGVVTHTIAPETAGVFEISVSAVNTDGTQITSLSNTFTIQPAGFDASATTVTAVPGSIEANGMSTSLITVQLKDQFDNNLTQGGASVVISSTAGSLLGNVSDNGDGSYTQELQSSTTAQTATVTTTVNSTAVNDNATVNFTAGGLDHFNVEKAGGGTIGMQTAGQSFNIRVTARDANDNLITAFNGSVDISSNKTMTAGSGTVSLTNGVFNNHSVTITGAGQNNVIISADNINGPETGTSNTFTVNPGPTDPATTTITPANEFIENTGTSTTLITVRAKDAFGNNRLTGGETVTLSTTAGTLQGSVTDNGDGTYTQTLQSSTAVATATITGTIGGINITDNAEVFFAEFNTWTSGGGGPNATTWSDGGNWTLGTPTPGQAVIIPTNPANDQQFPIIKSTTPTVAFLFVESSATLNVNSGQSLTVTNDITGTGALIVDNATLTVSGDISIANLNAGNSTVTLNGSEPQQIPGSLITEVLNVENTSPEGISSNGYVNASQTLTVNNSRLTMESGSTLDIYGDITGTGILIGNDADFIIGGDVTIDSVDVSNADVTFDPTFGSTGLQTINNITSYRNVTVNNVNGVIHNGDAAVSQTLTINSGSSLEVTGNLIVNTLNAVGGILKLQLDFSVANVLAAPQTVVFTGGNPQKLIDFDTFNDIEINKTANNVLSTSDVIATGTLTLTSGDLIIASGSNLIAANRTFTNGAIRFQLELPGRGWYMLSSPVASSYSDFLDAVVTQGYPGAFHSTGSLPGDTLQPNVLYYIESYSGTDNQRFRTLTNASNTVVEGRGHFVYAFGNVSGSTLYTRNMPRTLDVTQTSFSGPSDVAFNVTYSAADSLAVERGFNLVGNPYGATIDWDDGVNWTKTNMDNTIYIWDPSASGGFGEYKYWNGFAGSLGDGLIAPFQALWVKASAANPELTVKHEAKTTGGTYVTDRSGTEETHPIIELILESGSLQSKTYITFSENADRFKDRYDAYRLTPFTNTFLKLYTSFGKGTQLSINNLPEKFGKTVEIPVYTGGFMNAEPLNGTFTLSWPNLTNIPEGWRITLIDKARGEEVNFDTESSYAFTVTSAAKFKANGGVQASYSLMQNADEHKARFALQISPGAATGDIPEKLVLYQNFANPFSNSTKIEFGLPLQNEVRLVIYDILGRRVRVLCDQQYEAGYHSITWNPDRLASGVYLYVLKAGGKTKSKKMTYIK